MSDQEPARLVSAARHGSAGAARRGWRAAVAKAVLVLVALGSFTVAAALFPVPSVEQIRTMVDGAGWWGPLGFGAVYAALTLAPVPKNVLSTGAGVLFGFGPGLLIVYIATVLGVRLVPVLPFTAINYSAGLTSLGWWPYLLGTLLGIIPGTASYLALGAYGFEPGLQAQFALALLGVLTLAGVGFAARAHRRGSRADV